jgi:ubiquinone biosynthesis protein UbiJ
LGPAHKTSDDAASNKLSHVIRYGLESCSDNHDKNAHDHGHASAEVITEEEREKRAEEAPNLIDR